MIFLKRSGRQVPATKPSGYQPLFWETRLTASSSLHNPNPGAGRDVPPVTNSPCTAQLNTIQPHFWPPTFRRGVNPATEGAGCCLGPEEMREAGGPGRAAGGEAPGTGTAGRLPWPRRGRGGVAAVWGREPRRWAWARTGPKCPRQRAGASGQPEQGGGGARGAVAGRAGPGRASRTNAGSCRPLVGAERGAARRGGEGTGVQAGCGGGVRLGPGVERVWVQAQLQAFVFCGCGLEVWGGSGLICGCK